MTSLSTLVLPEDRTSSGWYRDYDGVWATTQHKDATISYSIDFTNELQSGETLSSTTSTESGPTLASLTTSSPNVTFTLTGTGAVTLTTTTSSSRVLVKELRFYDVSRGRSVVNDYNYGA